MMKYKLLIPLLFLGAILFAQNRTVIELQSSDFEMDELLKRKSSFLNIPNPEKNIDLTTFALRTASMNYRINYRLKDENGKNSDWQVLRRNPHYQTSDKNWVSQLIFLKKEAKAIQISIENEEDIVEKIAVIYYQEVTEDNAVQTRNFINPEKSACPCPQPEYLDRAGWCPTGDCTPHPNPVFTEVTHIIVHHAASTNASSNWSGVVRGIWDFHVNTNGWDDIGYNWLIDPEGVVYEGRGDNIRGAHFCATNSNTLGICMLGDFQIQAPQQIALTKLKEFLAWKTCDVLLDPEGIAFHASSGLQLNRISGHRQGCSTECPGSAFFPLFENLRADVALFREEECDVFLAPDNLSASLSANVQVDLSWRDNSSNEQEFILERSESTNANYTVITTLSENTVEYSDETVNPNTAYFYRIRAVNSSDSTAYSNEVGIATVVASQINIDGGQLDIYPNPAKDFLNIDTNNKKLERIYVTDNTGKILFVAEKINKTKVRLSLQNFSSGNYFLHLMMTEGIHTAIIKIQQ